MSKTPRNKWGDYKRMCGKHLSEYPENVQQAIRRMAEDYSVKSFKAETVAPEYKFYAGEGDRFVGVGSNGKSAGFEVVSEHSLGAAGLSHKIGEYFTMPVGSYLIRAVQYYTKYWMTVYKIQNMLQATN